MSSEVGADPKDVKDDNYRYLLKLRKNNYCVDMPRHPIQNKGLTSKGVLNYYSHRLSPFEKLECKNYQEIHCLPMNDTKIKAPENALAINYFKSYYELAVGDHIDYWYSIDKVIAKGRYGVVGAATEGKTRRKVAIKIMYKYSPKIYADCMSMMRIQEQDKDGSSYCVRMLNYGFFRGYHYIVMDPYDTDLKKYMDEHHPDGIDLDQIGKMTRSVLHGLVFLAKIGVVHADIQPSNILMNLNNTKELRIGGFGLSRRIISCVDHAKCQEKEYRAPEVFVYGRQTPAIDMWSFGCLIAEMTNNKIFIQGENTDDQFFAIQEIIGIPKKEFLASFSAKSYFYSSFTDPTPNHTVFRNGREQVDHGFCKASKDRQIPGTRPLRSIFRKSEEKDLLDFMTRALTWMPKRRITPQQALVHPFFVLCKTDISPIFREYKAPLKELT
uniref:Protein kinase domain-containing protein n=1 Tax=Caenorhabditis tropicalis TaxID=1561998 RepID=A0A1I7TC50_9PELO